MLLRRISIILILVNLTIGCSSKHSIFVDRDTHFQSARSIPPLRFPPGTTGHHFHSYYPTSSQTLSGGAKPVSLTPPGL